MSLTIPIDGRLKASSKQDIIDAIMMLPGIECVVVSPAERSVAAVSYTHLDVYKRQRRYQNEPRFFEQRR